MSRGLGVNMDKMIGVVVVLALVFAVAGYQGVSGAFTVNVTGNPALNDSVTFIAGVNCTLTQLENNITINCNGGNVTNDHALLDNLLWSSSGHTVDSDMDLSSYDLIDTEYAYPRHVHINDNGVYSPNIEDTAGNNYVFDVSLQNKSAVTNFKVFSNSLAKYPYFLGGKAGGNISNPLTMSVGSGYLFSISAVGYKTTDWSGKAAGVDFLTESVGWNDTNTPTAIAFGTTKNGSATIGYRWIINGSGALYPNFDATYEIGSSGKRVKNIYASVPDEVSTLDAVCTDGVRFYRANGLSSCLMSKGDFKTNITNKTVSINNFLKFQLIQYDQKIIDTDIIENVTFVPTDDEFQPIKEVVNATVTKSERLITRYGLEAKEVEKIDRSLVAYDGYGNVTGVRYEDFSVYLLDVVQQQQETINKICSRSPDLCK